jgi:hypothetical protein
MKNKTIIIALALSSLALCASSFAGTVPSDSANDSNTQYCGGPEWDKMDNTSNDYTSSDAADEISQAFASDNGKDPKGQAKLDAILKSYGYAAGSLKYGSDHMKDRDDDDRKLHGRHHEHHKRHHRHDKSPHC